MDAYRLTGWASETFALHTRPYIAAHVSLLSYANSTCGLWREASETSFRPPAGFCDSTSSDICLFAYSFALGSNLSIKRIWVIG